MYNLQIILYSWQFSDYGDTDSSHLSFLLTQQLSKWCAEFSGISQTLTRVFQGCSKIWPFLLLFESLVCQVPFLLAESPSAAGAANRSFAETLLSVLFQLPNVCQFTFEAISSLKAPPGSSSLPYVNICRQGPTVQHRELYSVSYNNL